MSTNINDPSTVYLLDEGLELWLIVIQYAPTPNDALIKLCDNLLPIIGELIAFLVFILRFCFGFVLHPFIFPHHPDTKRCSLYSRKNHFELEDVLVDHASVHSSLSRVVPSKVRQRADASVSVSP
jgi:hypothetical protein